MEFLDQQNKNGDLQGKDKKNISRIKMYDNQNKVKGLSKKLEDRKIDEKLEEKIKQLGVNRECVNPKR